MFGEKFKRKYALTDQGIQNIKKGTFWTVAVNLVVMMGMSILYLMMSDFMSVLIDGSPLSHAYPWFACGFCTLIFYNTFTAI